MEGIIIGVVDADQLSEMGIDLSQINGPVSEEELVEMGVDMSQLAGLMGLSGDEDDEVSEPAPAVKGLGWEAHCTRNGTNKSYRQVQTGTQVLVRYGPRGEAGETLVKDFDTREEADAYVLAQKYAKERAGFKVLFRGTIGIDDADPADLDTAETMFVDQWSAVIDPVFVKQSDSEDYSHWMLIHGLARTAHLDPLSTSLLTNLRALLHVEDPETDRLLAQVPNLKALRDLEVPGFGNTKTPWTNYGAEEITMTDFGTISGAETREQAEQVLSLYFPKHPSPEKLFATVRRALA